MGRRGGADGETCPAPRPSGYQRIAASTNFHQGLTTPADAADYVDHVPLTSMFLSTRVAASAPLRDRAVYSSDAVVLGEFACVTEYPEAMGRHVLSCKIHQHLPAK